MTVRSSQHLEGQEISILDTHRLQYRQFKCTIVTGGILKANFHETIALDNLVHYVVKQSILKNTRGVSSLYLG